MAVNRWSIPLDKLAGRKTEDIERVVRSFSIEMFARIILRTPVDTGRLRANWVASHDKQRTRIRKTTDSGGDRAMGWMVESVMTSPVGGTMWFTNSLPYAPVVEYGLYPDPPKSGNKTSGGYSKQAPYGMVRVTIAEAGAVLDQAIRQLRVPAR